MTSVEATLETDVALDGVLHGPQSLVGRVAHRAIAGRETTRRAGRWLHPVTDVATAGVLGLALVAVAELPPGVAVALVPVWAVLLLATRSYDARLTLLGHGERATRVLHAGTVLGLGCWVLSTLVALPASPAQLLLLTVTVTASTLACRGALGLLARARVTAPTRIVVAGDSGQVMRTVAELRRTPHLPFDVVALCVTGPTDPVAGAAALGPVDVPVGFGFEELAAVAAGSEAQAVVVLPYDALDPRAVQRLGWQLEATGTQLFVGTGLLDVSAARTTVTAAGGMRMLHVRSANHRGPARVVKDVWERVAAVVLLVVLMPALLAVAVTIRRGSAGRAIFRQSRVGRGGETFTMYKFRTMADGAEAQRDVLDGRNDADGVLFKNQSDPRVTPVGGVLRRYSLDELPQLLNVVRGQMSLVGPRPALRSEVERYDLDPRRRLAVKPGLTGLWQVSGRSDLSWEETVRLDLLYVDNWSFALDLSILLRTVRAVLGHRGAY